MKNHQCLFPDITVNHILSKVLIPFNIFNILSHQIPKPQFRFYVKDQQNVVWNPGKPYFYTPKYNLRQLVASRNHIISQWSTDLSMDWAVL